MKITSKELLIFIFLIVFAYVFTMKSGYLCIKNSTQILKYQRSLNLVSAHPHPNTVLKVLNKEEKIDYIDIFLGKDYPMYLVWVNGEFGYIAFSDNFEVKPDVFIFWRKCRIC